MRDIQGMCEQMRKHPDIKQEFETEWSEVFSVAEGAKEKVDKAVAPVREIEQLLLSLAEPLSKAFETQGASPNPKKIAAVLGRRAGGFCRSCGFKLTVGAAFCKNCGAKVR